MAKLDWDRERRLQRMAAYGREPAHRESMVRSSRTTSTRASPPPSTPITRAAQQLKNTAKKQKVKSSIELLRSFARVLVRQTRLTSEEIAAVRAALRSSSGLASKPQVSRAHRETIRTLVANLEMVCHRAGSSSSSTQVETNPPERKTATAPLPRRLEPGLIRPKPQERSPGPAPAPRPPDPPRAPGRLGLFFARLEELDDLMSRQNAAWVSTLEQLTKEITSLRPLHQIDAKDALHRRVSKLHTRAIDHRERSAIAAAANLLSVLPSPR